MHHTTYIGVMLGLCSCYSRWTAPFWRTRSSWTGGLLPSGRRRPRDPASGCLPPSWCWGGASPRGSWFCCWCWGWWSTIWCPSPSPPPPAQRATGPWVGPTSRTAPPPRVCPPCGTHPGSGPPGPNRPWLYLCLHSHSKTTRLEFPNRPYTKRTSSTSCFKADLHLSLICIKRKEKTTNTKQKQ